MEYEEDSRDSAIGTSLQYEQSESDGESEAELEPDYYEELSCNRLIAPVAFKENNETAQCDCDAAAGNPCARKGSCINVLCRQECDATCQAGNACENQKLRRHEFPKLEIMKTKKRGFGVKASESISSETIVAEYIGELINKDEMERRKRLDSRKNVYFFTVDSNTYIDAETAGSISRFINHFAETFENRNFYNRIFFLRELN